MIILGIETSCDETTAAMIEGRGNKVKVLSNIVASQIEIHKKYGGVVPEVAAREHVLNILPVINEALVKANLTPALSLVRRRGNIIPRTPRLALRAKRAFIKGAIDAIAVTVGPGLITSLLVGVETAKILAYVWKLPVIAVNHIEGHIYANWLPPISEIFNFTLGLSSGRRQFSIFKNNSKIFPAVILTVSGGHTMLVLMKGHGKYKTIGETRDDAAGESFDKAAQLLGLGYPGGPVISAYADKFNKSKIENRKSKITLPRPMIKDNSFDFSFSGLKTALSYQLKQDKNWRNKIPVYAAEFQQAVIDVLVNKTIKAAIKYQVKTVMLTGGVAANIELRQQLAYNIKTALSGVNFIMPDSNYCTDNAAMVAATGYFKAKRKEYIAWQKLKVKANLELK